MPDSHDGSEEIRAQAHLAQLAVAVGIHAVPDVWLAQQRVLHVQRARL